MPLPGPRMTGWMFQIQASWVQTAVHTRARTRSAVGNKHTLQILPFPISKSEMRWGWWGNFPVLSLCLFEWQLPGGGLLLWWAGEPGGMLISALRHLRGAWGPSTTPSPWPFSVEQGAGLCPVAKQQPGGYLAHLTCLSSPLSWQISHGPVDQVVSG